MTERESEESASVCDDECFDPAPDLNRDQWLELLSRSDRELLTLALAIMKADAGNIYTLDFIFLAALNRSRSNIGAFRVLIEKENYLAAAPFLRMQLDSVLRLYALRLVDDPSVLAKRILKGEALSKHKARDGNKLSDSYLRGKVSECAPWIDDVYRSCSGFVHLSEKHIFAYVENADHHGKLSIRISESQPDIQESTKCESVAAMCHINNLLFELCNDWLTEKAT